MTAREFSKAPGTLPMFARAAVAAVPLASRLPFVAGGGGPMPELELVINDVDVSRERLTAYNRVCGFSLSDLLPPTFPHILAFPLHLALMTDGAFPFAPVGLVHVRNQIIQHRAIRVAEVLTVRVRAGEITDHPAGRQFSLLTDVRVGEELVWEEESVNLRRGAGTRPPARGSRSSSEQGPEPELPVVAQWQLPGDLGRRYGSVSGDRNPIHMHSFSARLFGFPSAIAHGMWTLARCLAAMEGTLPGSYEVSASFKKPIRLPSTVVFCEAGGEDRSLRFEVRSARAGAPHLSGDLAGR